MRICPRQGGVKDNGFRLPGRKKTAICNLRLECPDFLVPTIIWAISAKFERQAGESALAEDRNASGCGCLRQIGVKRCQWQTCAQR
jgi:hypothetical protein